MLSYTPDDPNWMAATDTVPQKPSGPHRRFGRGDPDDDRGLRCACAADRLAGLGGAVPASCGGADRALPRVFFLPIVLALASIYAASHVPPQEWTHSFGLGGLFGDTVLGAVLNALPISAQAGLKLVAAAAFPRRGRDAVSRRGRQRGGVPRRHAVPDLWAAGVVGDGRRWPQGRGRGCGTCGGGAYKRRGSPAGRPGAKLPMWTPVQAGDEAGVVPHLAAEADDMSPVQFRRPQGFFGRLALRARAEDDDYLEADGLEPELPAPDQCAAG